jgi:hypothetical protein
MEWDQIAEKWAQMALRLRNDAPNIAQILGAGQINGGSESVVAQASAVFGSSDGLPPKTSAGRTVKDHALTPDQ